MSPRRMSLLLTALLFASSGCRALPGATQATSPEPVEPTSKLAPISLSDPPPDAGLAMQLCEVAAYVDQVKGMALVPRARDLPHYVPLTGREPEIATDDSAWVVEFTGDIARGAARGGVPPRVLHDPVCVVIGDTRWWFVPGGVTFNDGTAEPPMRGEPDVSLPPPQP